MRLAYGVATAFVTVGAALLLSAPANLLEQFGSDASKVKVAGCSGRLWWSGSCRIFLKSHGGWVSPGQVSFAWRFERGMGWYLALLHDGRAAGSLHPSFEGWQAKNLDVRLPILPLDGLPKHVYDIWQPIARVTIMAQSISCAWQLSECFGKVRIRIDGLSLGKAADPLGNYLLDLDLRPDGGIQGQFQTTSGALTLQGRLEALKGASLRLAGRANIGVGVGDDVRRLLETVGKPAGANAFSFPRES